MLKLRVYTENKQLQDMCQIADFYFPSGYTVIGCAGVWRGKHEPSIIFEVILDTSEKSLTFAAEDFASDIKDFNRQEAVLYTIEEVKAALV